MTESADMSKPKRSNNRSSITSSGRRDLVLVDYDGSVGRATREKGALRNQGSVPHRLSPLMLFTEENGAPDLHLQPGLNLIEAETYERYAGSGERPPHPQFIEKVEKGYIAVLEGLPRLPRDMLALIERTIDHAALAWLKERVGDENAFEDRPEILDAIDDRLAKARPVKLRPNTYQGSLPASVPRSLATMS